jgi:uncharacterized protein YjiS (DUF1127 family)
MTASTLQTFFACRRAVDGPRSGGAVERAVAPLREWRGRSSDRAKLAIRDDRMLREIAITRAEAESLSREPRRICSANDSPSGGAIQ